MTQEHGVDGTGEPLTVIEAYARACAVTADQQAEVMNAIVTHRAQVAQLTTERDQAVRHRDQARASSMEWEAATVRAEAGRDHLRARCAQLEQTSADDLRASGWSVAAHNDYRQNGVAYTFWLLTHPDGCFLKGEGRTDAEALSIIRAALDQTHSDDHPHKAGGMEYWREAAGHLQAQVIRLSAALGERVAQPAPLPPDEVLQALVAQLAPIPKGEGNTDE